jgi:hypothetical protein
MTTPQITLSLTLLAATLLSTTPARAQGVPRPHSAGFRGVPQMIVSIVSYA